MARLLISACTLPEKSATSRAVAMSPSGMDMWNGLTEKDGGHPEDSTITTGLTTTDLLVHEY